MAIEHRVRCLVCGGSTVIPAAAAQNPALIPQHCPRSWHFGQVEGLYWAACSLSCKQRVTPELVKQRHDARIRGSRR